MLLGLPVHLMMHVVNYV